MCEKVNTKKDEVEKNNNQFNCNKYNNADELGIWMVKLPKDVMGIIKLYYNTTEEAKQLRINRSYNGLYKFIKCKVDLRIDQMYQRLLDKEILLIENTCNFGSHRDNFIKFDKKEVNKLSLQLLKVVNKEETINAILNSFYLVINKCKDPYEYLKKYIWDIYYDYFSYEWMGNEAEILGTYFCSDDDEDDDSYLQKMMIIYLTGLESFNLNKPQFIEFIFSKYPELFLSKFKIINIDVTDYDTKKRLKKEKIAYIHNTLKYTTQVYDFDNLKINNNQKETVLKFHKKYANKGFCPIFTKSDLTPYHHP